MNFYQYTRDQSDKLGIKEAFFWACKGALWGDYHGIKIVQMGDALPRSAGQVMDHVYRRTIPFKKVLEYITSEDILEGKESIGIQGMIGSRSGVQRDMKVLLNRKWVFRSKIMNGYFYAINLPKVLFEIADKYEDEEFPKIMPQKSRELLRKVKSNKDIKKIQGLYMNLFDHNPEAVKKKITERRQKKVRNQFRTKNEMHQRLFGRWVEFIADSVDTEISISIVSTTARTRNFFKYLIKDLDAQPESSEEKIAERLKTIIGSWPYIRGKWVQSELGKAMKIPEIPFIPFVFTYRAEVFAKVESVKLELQNSIPLDDSPMYEKAVKEGSW